MEDQRSRAESPGSPRRVMLLASARTGSNLLLSLLSGHPRIKTYGEVFNLDALPDESLCAALEDPQRYLEARVSGPYRPGTSVVVFKMFYYHLRPPYVDPASKTFYTLHHLQDRSARVSAIRGRDRDWSAYYPRWQRLWESLIADRELDVLHLQRCNMLDTLVSMKMAHQTNQWWRVTRDNAPPVRMRLDPEECVEYFEELATLSEDADRSFAGHHRFTVTYEAMVQRQAETLSQIFEFLGVPWHSVSTRMKKQLVAPIPAIVENYDEIREHCRQTQWMHFFNQGVVA